MAKIRSQEMYLMIRKEERIKLNELIIITVKNCNFIITILYKGEDFIVLSHKERLYNFLYKQAIDINDLPPRDIAILFLFIAGKSLWKLSEGLIDLIEFDFKKISLKRISTEGYALYQTAKTISTGKEYTKASAFSDLDKLVKDLYLSEKIAVASKESEKFNSSITDEAQID